MRTSSAALVPGDAETRSRSGSPSDFRSGRGRPIDLVHLSRQTFGDKRLETELLRLFVRQSEQILANLEADERPHTEEGRAGNLLHLLLGSARAVGATAVADIAERLEAEQRRHAEGSALSEGDRAALGAAVRRTNGFIAGLLEPG